MEDVLVIGDKVLHSRLFIGTGKFADLNVMGEAIRQSGAQVITVALRRIDFGSNRDSEFNHIPEGCILMPNTSGARNAQEAVRIAHLARAAGCGNWIKIEVVSDSRYLLPDNFETVKATEILAKEGFVVLPYMCPDLMAAKRLKEAGAAAVMPLGAPIGTNRGLKTRELIQILIDEIDIPVIVDAGIGKPSDATAAMEMGISAVLVNTAIATAGDPIGMAKAFRDGVIAGRTAYLSGMAFSRQYAEASSPLTGFLR